MRGEFRGQHIDEVAESSDFTKSASTYMTNRNHPSFFSRNPNLFLCEDLFVYVREVSPHKKCLVLLNKADFLTENQRQAWCDYFKSRDDDLKVVFFSALDEAAAKDEEEEVSLKGLLAFRYFLSSDGKIFRSWKS